MTEYYPSPKMKGLVTFLKGWSLKTLNHVATGVSVVDLKRENDKRWRFRTTNGKIWFQRGVPRFLKAQIAADDSSRCLHVLNGLKLLLSTNIWALYFHLNFLGLKRNGNWHPKLEKQYFALKLINENLVIFDRMKYYVVLILC